jgi:hypothetical protein
MLVTDTLMSAALAHDEFEKAIEDRIAELFIQHNYTAEVQGEVVPSDEALKKAASRVFRSAVVKSKTDRKTVGKSKWDAYVQLFPHGPRQSDDESLSEVDAVVMNRLARQVWGLTQVAPNGRVQSDLEKSDDEEEAGRVLIRATVVRGHDPVEVAYVSANHDLLLEDSLRPELEAILRRSRRLNKHAAMLARRQPEIAARAEKAIEAGMKAAASEARIDLQLALGPGESK